MSFCNLWVFLLAFLISSVCGGLFPVVDGVIGGVPKVHPRLSRRMVSALVNVTTPGKLRVIENSGICGKPGFSSVATSLDPEWFDRAETTPGVYQASGYGDLTATESMWWAPISRTALQAPISLYHYRFWFFAARNKPATAPVTLWFNGGVSSYPIL